MELSTKARDIETTGRKRFSDANGLARFAWRVVMAAIVGVFLLAASGQGLACSLLEGRDWGGLDLAPVNGDVLSGSFTNIGRFVIDAGDTVRAGSSVVTFTARDIVIDGVFHGGPELLPTLSLTSTGNITVRGTLDQWSSLSFTAGNIILAGSISILNASGDVTVLEPPPSGIVLSSGVSHPDSKGAGGILQGPDGSWIVGSGSVSLNAVPLPPSLLFLAPGLAGVLLMRRGSKNRPSHVPPV